MLGFLSHLYLSSGCWLSLQDINFEWWFNRRGRAGRVIVGVVATPGERRADLLQGSTKVGAPGLVNFITAVAYHFCPACLQHSCNLVHRLKPISVILANFIKEIKVEEWKDIPNRGDFRVYSNATPGASPLRGIEEPLELRFRPQVPCL